MASMQSKATVRAAKILRYKKWSNRQYSLMMDLYKKNPLNRRYLRIEKRLRIFPKKAGGAKLEYKNIAGRNCGIIHPQGHSEKVLLFLHGGAYVIGPNSHSWTFLQKVSQSMGWNAILPDYPKAPEWNYQRTLDYMEALYRNLLNQYRPEDILLAGSSAGAGLALSSIYRWNDNSLPLPERLILISPWLDLALDHPDLDELEQMDISLSRETLLQAAKLYRGRQDSLDPSVSPLYGDLSLLPPTMILTGTHELFLHHCRELYHGIQQAGGQVEYIEEEGLFHSWPVMHQLPEADQAREKIANFLKGA